MQSAGTLSTWMLRAGHILASRKSMQGSCLDRWAVTSFGDLQSSHSLCEALWSILDPFMLDVWVTEWIPDAVKTWNSTCCHTGTSDYKLDDILYKINITMLCTQVQAQWSIMKTLTLGLRGCWQYFFCHTMRHRDFLQHDCKPCSLPYTGTLVGSRKDTTSCLECFLLKVCTCCMQRMVI